MKYLKTFEDLVTLDLNNTQKEKLMNLAIENDEVNIVKGLLDSGYMPDFLDDLQAGADTSIFVDKGEDWKYDFYDLLDESDRLTKTLKKKILDFLKNEAPKQYDYYLMKKNINKYNL